MSEEVVRYFHAIHWRSYTKRDVQDVAAQWEGVTNSDRRNAALVQWTGY